MATNSIAAPALDVPTTVAGFLKLLDDTLGDWRQDSKDENLLEEVVEDLTAIEEDLAELQSWPPRLRGAWADEVDARRELKEFVNSRGWQKKFPTLGAGMDDGDLVRGRHRHYDSY